MEQSQAQPLLASTSVAEYVRLSQTLLERTRRGAPLAEVARAVRTRDPGQLESPVRPQHGVGGPSAALANAGASALGGAIAHYGAAPSPLRPRAVEKDGWLAEVQKALRSQHASSAARLLPDTFDAASPAGAASALRQSRSSPVLHPSAATPGEHSHRLRWGLRLNGASGGSPVTLAMHYRDASSVLPSSTGVVSAEPSSMSIPFGDGFDLVPLPPHESAGPTRGSIASAGGFGARTVSGGPYSAASPDSAAGGSRRPTVSLPGSASSGGRATGRQRQPQHPRSLSPGPSAVGAGSATRSGGRSLAGSRVEPSPQRRLGSQFDLSSRATAMYATSIIQLGPPQPGGAAAVALGPTASVVTVPSVPDVFASLLLPRPGHRQGSAEGHGAASWQGASVGSGGSGLFDSEYEGAAYAAAQGGNSPGSGAGHRPGGGVNALLPADSVFGEAADSMVGVAAGLMGGGNGGPHRSPAMRGGLLTAASPTAPAPAARGSPQRHGLGVGGAPAASRSDTPSGGVAGLPPRGDPSSFTPSAPGTRSEGLRNPALRDVPEALRPSMRLEAPPGSRSEAWGLSGRSRVDQLRQMLAGASAAAGDSPDAAAEDGGGAGRGATQSPQQPSRGAAGGAAGGVRRGSASPAGSPAHRRGSSAPPAQQPKLGRGGDAASGEGKGGEGGGHRQEGEGKDSSEGDAASSSRQPQPDSARGLPSLVSLVANSASPRLRVLAEIHRSERLLEKQEAAQLKAVRGVGNQAFAVAHLGAPPAEQGGRYSRSRLGSRSGSRPGSRSRNRRSASGTRRSASRGGGRGSISDDEEGGGSGGVGSGGEGDSGEEGGREGAPAARRQRHHAIEGIRKDLTRLAQRARTLPGEQAGAGAGAAAGGTGGAGLPAEASGGAGREAETEAQRRLRLELPGDPSAALRAAQQLAALTARRQEATRARAPGASGAVTAPGEGSAAGASTRLPGTARSAASRATGAAAGAAGPVLGRPPLPSSPRNAQPKLQQPQPASAEQPPQSGGGSRGGRRPNTRGSNVTGDEQPPGTPLPSTAPGTASGGPGLELAGGEEEKGRDGGGGGAAAVKAYGLQFNTSPDAQLFYGSTVALESIDGWFLTVHPRHGAVAVREPDPNWYEKGAMPFKRSKGVGGTVKEPPHYLFKLVNLKNPLENGPIRYGDPVWLQVAPGRGESGWRSGSVLAPYLHHAVALDTAGVDLTGRPADFHSAAAAAEGDPLLKSALQAASAENLLFGMPSTAAAGSVQQRRAKASGMGLGPLLGDPVAGAAGGGVGWGTAAGAAAAGWEGGVGEPPSGGTAAGAAAAGTGRGTGRSGGSSGGSARSLGAGGGGAGGGGASLSALRLPAGGGVGGSPAPPHGPSPGPASLWSMPSLSLDGGPSGAASASSSGAAPGAGGGSGALSLAGKLSAMLGGLTPAAGAELLQLLRLLPPSAAAAILEGRRDGAGGQGSGPYGALQALASGLLDVEATDRLFPGGEGSASAVRAAASVLAGSTAYGNNSRGLASVGAASSLSGLQSPFDGVLRHISYSLGTRVRDPQRRSVHFIPPTGTSSYSATLDAPLSVVFPSVSGQAAGAAAGVRSPSHSPTRPHAAGAGAAAAAAAAAAGGASSSSIGFAVSPASAPSSPAGAQPQGGNGGGGHGGEGEDDGGGTFMTAIGLAASPPGATSPSHRRPLQIGDAAAAGAPPGGHWQHPQQRPPQPGGGALSEGSSYYHDPAAEAAAAELARALQEQLVALVQRLLTRDLPRARPVDPAAFVRNLHRDVASNARTNPLDRVGLHIGVPRPIVSHVPLPYSATDFLFGPATSSNRQGIYRRNDPGYHILYEMANARPMMSGKWRLQVALKEVTEDGYVIGGLGFEGHVEDAGYTASTGVKALLQQAVAAGAKRTQLSAPPDPLMGAGSVFKLRRSGKATGHTGRLRDRHKDPFAVTAKAAGGGEGRGTGGPGGGEDGAPGGGGGSGVAGDDEDDPYGDTPATKARNNAAAAAGSAAVAASSEGDLVREYVLNLTEVYLEQEWFYVAFSPAQPESEAPAAPAGAPASAAGAARGGAGSGGAGSGGAGSGGGSSGSRPGGVGQPPGGGDGTQVLVDYGSGPGRAGSQGRSGSRASSGAHSRQDSDSGRAAGSGRGSARSGREAADSAADEAEELALDGGPSFNLLGSGKDLAIAIMSGSGGSGEGGGALRPGRAAADGSSFFRQKPDGAAGGNRRPTHLQPHAGALSGVYKVDRRGVFRVRLLQAGDRTEGTQMSRDDSIALKARSQLRRSERQRLGVVLDDAAAGSAANADGGEGGEKAPGGVAAGGSKPGVPGGEPAGAPPSASASLLLSAASGPLSLSAVGVTPAAQLSRALRLARARALVDAGSRYLSHEALKFATPETYYGARLKGALRGLAQDAAAVAEAAAAAEARALSRLQRGTPFLSRARDPVPFRAQAALVAAREQAERRAVRDAEAAPGAPSAAAAGSQQQLLLPGGIGGLDAALSLASSIATTVAPSVSFSAEPPSHQGSVAGGARLPAAAGAAAAAPSPPGAASSKHLQGQAQGHGHPGHGHGPHETCRLCRGSDGQPLFAVDLCAVGEQVDADVAAAEAAAAEDERLRRQQKAIAEGLLVEEEEEREEGWAEGKEVEQGEDAAGGAGGVGFRDSVMEGEAVLGRRASLLSGGGSLSLSPSPAASPVSPSRSGAFTSPLLPTRSSASGPTAALLAAAAAAGAAAAAAGPRSPGLHGLNGGGPIGGLASLASTASSASAGGGQGQQQAGRPRRPRKNSVRRLQISLSEALKAVKSEAPADAPLAARMEARSIAMGSTAEMLARHRAEQAAAAEAAQAARAAAEAAGTAAWPGGEGAGGGEVSAERSLHTASLELLLLEGGDSLLSGGPSLELTTPPDALGAEGSAAATPVPGSAAPGAAGRSGSTGQAKSRGSSSGGMFDRVQGGAAFASAAFAATAAGRLSAKLRTSEGGSTSRSAGRDGGASPDPAAASIAAVPGAAFAAAASASLAGAGGGDSGFNGAASPASPSAARGPRGSFSFVAAAAAAAMPAASGRGGASGGSLASILRRSSGSLSRRLGRAAMKPASGLDTLLQAASDGMAGEADFLASLQAQDSQMLDVIQYRLDPAAAAAAGGAAGGSHSVAGGASIVSSAPSYMSSGPLGTAVSPEQLAFSHHNTGDAPGRLGGMRRDRPSPAKR